MEIIVILQIQKDEVSFLEHPASFVPLPHAPLQKSCDILQNESGCSKGSKMLSGLDDF